jgi:hypothetical protein
VLRSPSAIAALALEKASDEAACLFRLSSLFQWKAGKSPNKHALNDLRPITIKERVLF